MDFDRLPRADITELKNEHSIYRVYKIAGLRRSKYYSGSGIEKTYNMESAEADFPDDPEAVPDFAEVEVGNGYSKRIIRKSVNHKTLTCPRCGTEGRQTSSGQKFCPDCGLLLGRADADSYYGHRLARNPDAAERLEDDPYE